MRGVFRMAFAFIGVHLRTQVAFFCTPHILCRTRTSQNGIILFAQPEPPDDKTYQRDTDQIDPQHHGLPSGVKKRNRLALVTTVSDEAAMAAPAIIGLSSRPRNGYNTPAATGMPRVL